MNVRFQSPDEIPSPAAPVTADALTIKRLALEACCDPRSIVHRLQGRKVRGLTGARIDRVLREAGLL
jgi:hypothetical protein